ncbi:MAG: YfcE family phosphodiesterase [Chitinispirillales bacterium]|jgi:putative phosphoesterase|nr:YfcE family phosphodiesterase [Chitinispirillales bacterium]
MKIGVISDTHRNHEYIEKAVQFLVKKQNVSAIYHLGDDYDDVKALEDYHIEIAQVPGTYDEGYRNKSLPAKITETVLGINILLVHSIDKDAADSDLFRADIILHGHTHIAELRLDDGHLFMNPGHLKGPLDRNMPPTFGILTVLDREVSAAVYDLKMKVVNSIELTRTENGLHKSYG